ncbi:hypothetical protein Celaphus_00019459 [Cervus elaphus hippelaphus]|uniref:Uncharacterized protein n=1 Tax=Cervus elaphus hippelaphus TaxID=46360 RepID=A0A212C377_CEREH|nr:hypothetical protein Celaphus_00019459 [Cervus elaphus hippelaphus]
MLTGTGQFDTIGAQIRCPPLLHGQLKTVVLEAWDLITPQGEPTGSYTKILQGPNETDCPKKVNKKPPKICPHCHTEMHWAKECKSKFYIEGKPILGNSKQETPRSPSTKTWGKFHLFPQTLNIRQCCQMYQP